MQGLTRHTQILVLFDNGYSVAQNPVIDRCTEEESDADMTRPKSEARPNNCSPRCPTFMILSVLSHTPTHLPNPNKTQSLFFFFDYKTSPTPAYLFSIFEGSDSIHPFIIATCCFFFIIATCCFLIIDIIYNIWDYVLLCVLIHDCLLPHSIFMFV